MPGCLLYKIVILSFPCSLFDVTLDYRYILTSLLHSYLFSSKDDFIFALTTEMSEYEQYPMDTYNDLAFNVFFFSALCCISIIKHTIGKYQPSQNDPLNSALASNNEWSEQEISNLVDYLFHHLTTNPGGSLQPGTYENLAIHLAQRHPDHKRTVEAIRSQFNSVRIFWISNCMWTQ
jgi:hypothetical protein